MISVIREACKAIAYLHENKIAHRDIKLDNILLDGKMNIKLTDYGLIVKDVKLYYSEVRGALLYLGPEHQRKDY